MSRPRIIPALSDLNQETTGPVQLQLLKQWAAGPRDRESAASLLEPFRVDGTVVATDASGLSKMTDSMDLVRVLAMISRPKEVIHALGVEVGGRAIGHWTADNTEMMYASTIPAEDVVQAMWEVQQRSLAMKLVPIGMCAHAGTFYEIGSSLYGPDATAVEQLAEDYAQGGEFLVTRAVREKLSPSTCEFKARADLGRFNAWDARAVVRAGRRPELAEKRRDYPHFYTDDFIRDLSAIESAPDPEALIADIYGRYLRAEAVVFLARARSDPGPHLDAILDDLLTNALIDAVVLRSIPHRYLVRCSSGLSILTFPYVEDALQFALDIREKFLANDIPMKIGIDYGAILYFDRPDGQRNLMGDPVNVVSKIAEDAGLLGRVCITTRATEVLSRVPENAQPFKMEISRITITGHVL